MQHTKFKSIEHFRNIIKAVQHDTQSVQKDGEWVIDNTIPLPTLQFTGTVKAHGTNSGIAINNSEYIPMSSNNAITPQNDNAGFAQFALRKEFRQHMIELNSKVRKLVELPETYHLVFFGEWCGKGIQKGVALNQLKEKLWLVFAVKVMTNDEDISNYWLQTDEISFTYPNFNMYDIKEFGTYNIDINFNDPALIQNELIKITEDIEKECPIGKYFGVSGVGEGAVWKHGNYMFKVKGEKHSVTKARKLAEVDIEKLNSINEFVEYAVTEQRLEQMAIENLMIDGVVKFDRKNLGKFVKAVSTDVIKEELDTLQYNKLEMKDVGNKLSRKAKEWFFSQELI